MRKPAKTTALARAVKVVEDETPTEVLAASIAEIAKAMKSLTASRLRHDTLVLLISHSSKVPQKTVKAVLESISTIDKNYLK